MNTMTTRRAGFVRRVFSSRIVRGAMSGVKVALITLVFWSVMVLIISGMMLVIDRGGLIAGIAVFILTALALGVITGIILTDDD